MPGASDHPSRIARSTGLVQTSRLGSARRKFAPTVTWRLLHLVTSCYVHKGVVRPAEGLFWASSATASEASGCFAEVAGGSGVQIHYAGLMA